MGIKSSSKRKLDPGAKRHEMEKPFACDQCDYRCTTSGILRAHQRQHL